MNRTNSLGAANGVFELPELRKLFTPAFSCVFGFLLVTNFQWYLYSALNSANADRFAPPALSLEALASAVIICLGLACTLTARSTTPSPQFVSNAIPIFGFAIFNVVLQLSLLSNDAVRTSIIFVGIAAVFASAVAIGRRYGAQIARRFFYVTWLFPLGTAVWLLYFGYAGRLDHPWGLIRPQIVGGLRSAEMSLFLGVQMSYCIFSLKAEVPKTIALLNRIAVGVGTIMVLWLASVSAMFWVLAGAAFYILTMRSGPARQLVIFACALFLIGYVIYDQVVLNNLIKYSALIPYTDASFELRAFHYHDLWTMSWERPLTGLGLDSFYMPPHHNILGLAEGTGWISASLYMLQMLMMFVVSWRVVSERKRMDKYAARFLLMAVCCYWHIQLKGFTQDTWQLKELYLWGGLIVGCYTSVSPRAATKTLSMERHGQAARAVLPQTAPIAGTTGS